MKVTHHTLQTSGRMSVNCHGSVPSTVVATVTWHVVGLRRGEQKACPWTVSGSRFGESFGGVKAANYVQREVAQLPGELRRRSWQRKVTGSEVGGV